MQKSELNQMLSETQQRMESLSISGSSPQRSTSEPNIEHLRKEVYNVHDADWRPLPNTGVFGNG